MKLRNVIVMMAAALGLAGILVAQVFRQNAYVRLSKQIRLNDKKAEALRNEIASAEMEVRKLKSLSRIEALAQRGLGLEYETRTVMVRASGAAGQVALAEGKRSLALAP